MSDNISDKVLKTFNDLKQTEPSSSDVSSDEKAGKEMVEKSGQMGVPVIDIDGKILVGFDEEKLKGALKI